VAGGGPRVTVVSRPPWLSCRSRRTSRRSTREIRTRSGQCTA